MGDTFYMLNLQTVDPSTPFNALSPYEEMGAYEALWCRDKASFKTIADMVRDQAELLLSQLIPPSESKIFAARALDHLLSRGVEKFGVHVRPDASYPVRLLDADNPVELLYYIGNWDLIYTPSVAVVGTRNPSREGVARARNIARALVADGYTIVSGLAKGIDTQAHRAAIDMGGSTIAVIGTSIGSVYPHENAELQEEIAKNHLVISQVPVLRYSQQGPSGNRFFFPERNITMSAMTCATIIVEAGETSGTLIQARAALKQGRKLFILDSCFNNPALTWPSRFEQQGAIRVREYKDIQNVIGSAEKADSDR
jgi:DNA processing protein